MCPFYDSRVSIMRGPKPPAVNLTDKERQGLEQLVRRHSTPQQLALRGRIVLAAADGKNNTQIAREFGITVDTARQWRNRWLALQPTCVDDLTIAERLEDLPRPGTPARITTDQRCQIEAMACGAGRLRPAHQPMDQPGDCRRDHETRHCRLHLAPPCGEAFKKTLISNLIWCAIG